MDENVLLGKVMRNLGAAWRALRLYPEASPLRHQAILVVCDAVSEYLQAEPTLKVGVVRGGLIFPGVESVFTNPGLPDLAEALGTHGIGEVHFVAPPVTEEIAALLHAVQERPHERHAKGGIQSALTEANVASIKVIAVVLTRVELPPEIPEDEADTFLAELAADAGRLAVWLRSLLACDDEGLSEGILMLASAAGDVRVFGRTLATAFHELESDDKDRLLEAAMTIPPIERVSVEMLANLSSVELTAALRGGRYGTNQIALSYALTKLPVGQRRPELLHEAEAALLAADEGIERVRFLNGLIRSRMSPTPPVPLAEAQPAYRSILQATALRPEHLAAVQRAALSRRQLDEAGVTTVLHLLDTAEDFLAYSRVLEALARSVPHLFRNQQPDLAMRVVRELARRAESLDRPWPELPPRFGEVLSQACGALSIAALMDTPELESRAIECARELVALGGDNAARDFAMAAVSSESDNSIELAALVLGRRLPELLVTAAPHADARHIAKMAELFARDGGRWCLEALGQLTTRPEDRIRADAARGIATAGGIALQQHMPRLLRDPARTVAQVAARALGRNGGPGTVEMLAGRLGELEGDKDLPLAREIVGVLTVSPSPAADAALKQLAERGGFLRKNKHAEMRRLAVEALDMRRKRKDA